MGKYHTIILTKEGKVLVFGSNKFGCLGTNVPESTYVTDKSAIEHKFKDHIAVAISANEYNSACVVNGQIYYWGRGFESKNYEKPTVLGKKDKLFFTDVKIGKDFVIGINGQMIYMM